MCFPNTIIIEVVIEIRKYHDHRLCTCALIRAPYVVQNVSSVFVRCFKTLLQYLAEVLASDR